LPCALLSGPEAADNFSVRTLRQLENRPGGNVEIDRSPYGFDDGNRILVTFAGEKLIVKGSETKRSGIVSVRATFVNQKTIRIHEMHFHWPYFRDVASYLGLLMVSLYWIRSVKTILYRRHLPRSC